MAVVVTCKYVSTSSESLAYVNIQGYSFRALLMNVVYQEQSAGLDLVFRKGIHVRSPPAEFQSSTDCS
jgi:hypothetical protein